ncbi:hypothetical protein A6A40_23550 (plasmid) [Azospirillum humicireducens]|uniref:Transposase IS204/IS1001/IS1096/IS1165 zinc-finger domain-containing protein n=1 Tax=Azospirillum humicireducens TaxID=1226968 RepID=A0A2R4VUA4_9PROT|nr:transposase family protein [Azospirillum humicireducens]AWB08026.1 hypothetical protein A6A40_23550 [Azospirillum humicireducens]
MSPALGGITPDQAELRAVLNRRPFCRGKVILADNRRGSAHCPHCGAVSRVVHSRYRRSPADLPAFGHELRVALLVRRFHCRQAMPQTHVCRAFCRRCHASRPMCPAASR